MSHLIVIHLNIELFDTHFEFEQLAINITGNFYIVFKQWESKRAKLKTEMSHLIVIHLNIELFDTNFEFE